MKLAAGPDVRTQTELAMAYRKVDAEDDTLLGSLTEALGTHPMIIRRIEELRKYAKSNQYRRLMGRLN